MISEVVAMSGKSTNSSVWDLFWHGDTPDDEIRMWDFYGGVWNDKSSDYDDAEYIYIAPLLCLGGPE